MPRRGSIFSSHSSSPRRGAERRQEPLDLSGRKKRTNITACRLLEKASGKDLRLRRRSLERNGQQQRQPYDGDEGSGVGNTQGDNPPSTNSFAEDPRGPRRWPEAGSVRRVLVMSALTDDLMPSVSRRVQVYRVRTYATHRTIEHEYEVED